jgi:nucleoside-diphosphate-sugar epimerase
VSRVLVTGASGFIGRHVLPACLRAGHEVHAVSSHALASDRRLPSSRGEVRWHQADLLDPAEAASLVARVRPELLAFAAAGGRRAVMAGTCAEYDWAAIGPVGRERPLPRCHELCTPTGAHTLYGTCKWAANAVAERYAASVDVELAYGRVFFLYGPDEQPGRLVAQVARSLLAGERVATSDGHQIRDFLHVEDVAGAFAAILQSDVLGAVNIASGEPLTVREVIESIAALVGRQELVDWGAHPRPEGDPEVLLADVTRLRQEVGFTGRTSLADGLAAAVAWWRAQPQAQPARSA